MARRSFSLLSSPCLFCRSVSESPRFLAQQRFYSTKKKTKRSSVVVQLIKDVPRWGPKDAFIRVAPGFMRNYLYHSREARYVIGQELKDLLQSGVRIERNSNFQVEKKEDVVKPMVDAMESMIFEDSPVDKLTPAHSMDLLATFVPSTLSFERAINTSASASPETSSKASGSSIFGSVSLADIVSEIKASVSHNPEAAQIPLEESHITIEGITEGRIKTLGTFQLSISMDGERKLPRRVEVYTPGQKAPGLPGSLLKNIRQGITSRSSPKGL